MEHGLWYVFEVIAHIESSSLSKDFPCCVVRKFTCGTEPLAAFRIYDEATEYADSHRSSNHFFVVSASEVPVWWKGQERVDA